MKNISNCIVRIATSADLIYAASIAEEMAVSASKRGTGINRRPATYVQDKMKAGLAVIAIDVVTSEWAGFCCIEVWDHEKYVANSGLIVSPDYRGMGISRSIKIQIFELARIKFPQATIFSLTTNKAVLHVNRELGFKQVAHKEILNDLNFLTGCNSWVNYIDLMINSKLDYIAMIYESSVEKQHLSNMNFDTPSFPKSDTREVPPFPQVA